MECGGVAREIRQERTGTALGPARRAGACTTGVGPRNRRGARRGSERIRQYGHGPGPHSGGTAGRGRAPEEGAAGNGAEVWREGGNASAGFCRGAIARRTERDRGTQARVAHARGTAREFRRGRAGRLVGKRRSGGTVGIDGRRILSRLPEESARRTEERPEAAGTPQGL